ncbi:hypothetical protein DINM_005340 [Dirofilaria immitis]|nr:hypothetical protein [Dirofilaria immitis]
MARVHQNLIFGLKWSIVIHQYFQAYNFDDHCKKILSRGTIPNQTREKEDIIFAYPLVTARREEKIQKIGQGRMGKKQRAQRIERESSPYSSGNSVVQAFCTIENLPEALPSSASIFNNRADNYRENIDDETKRAKPCKEEEITSTSYVFAPMYTNDRYSMFINAICKQQDTTCFRGDIR